MQPGPIVHYLLLDAVPDKVTYEFMRIFGALAFRDILSYEELLFWENGAHTVSGAGEDFEFALGWKIPAQESLESEFMRFRAVRLARNFLLVMGNGVFLLGGLWALYAVAVLLRKRHRKLHLRARQVLLYVNRHLRFFGLLGLNLQFRGMSLDGPLYSTSSFLSVLYLISLLGLELGVAGELNNRALRKREANDFDLAALIYANYPVTIDLAWEDCWVAAGPAPGRECARRLEYLRKRLVLNYHLLEFALEVAVSAVVCHLPPERAGLQSLLLVGLYVCSLLLVLVLRPFARRIQNFVGVARGVSLLGAAATFQLIGERWAAFESEEARLIDPREVEDYCVKGDQFRDFTYMYFCLTVIRLLIDLWCLTREILPRFAEMRARKFGCALQNHLRNGSLILRLQNEGGEEQHALRRRRVNIVNLSLVHFEFVPVRKMVVRRGDRVFESYSELIDQSQRVRPEDLLEDADTEPALLELVRHARASPSPDLADLRLREPASAHTYELVRERLNLEERSVLVDVTLDGYQDVYRGRLGSDFTFPFILQQLFDLQHYQVPESREGEGEGWRDSVVLFTPQQKIVVGAEFLTVENSRDSAIKHTLFLRRVLEGGSEGEILDVSFNTMFADFRQNSSLFRPSKNLSTEKPGLYLQYDRKIERVNYKPGQLRRFYLQQELDRDYATAFEFTPEEVREYR